MTITVDGVANCSYNSPDADHQLDDPECHLLTIARELLGTTTTTASLLQLGLSRPMREVRSFVTHLWNEAWPWRHDLVSSR
jgi:hypothetical protein